MFSGPLRLHWQSTFTKYSFFVAVGGKHDFYTCKKKKKNQFFSPFLRREVCPQFSNLFCCSDFCENLTLKKYSRWAPNLRDF